MATARFWDDRRRARDDRVVPRPDPVGAVRPINTRFLAFANESGLLPPRLSAERASLRCSRRAPSPTAGTRRAAGRRSGRTSSRSAGRARSRTAGGSSTTRSTASGCPRRTRAQIGSSTGSRCRARACTRTGRRAWARCCLSRSGTSSDGRRSSGASTAGRSSSSAASTLYSTRSASWRAAAPPPPCRPAARPPPARRRPHPPAPRADLAGARRALRRRLRLSARGDGEVMELGVTQSWNKIDPARRRGSMRRRWEASRRRRTWAPRSGVAGRREGGPSSDKPGGTPFGQSAGDAEQSEQV